MAACIEPPVNSDLTGLYPRGDDQRASDERVQETVSEPPPGWESVLIPTGTGFTNLVVKVRKYLAIRVPNGIITRNARDASSPWLRIFRVVSNGGSGGARTM